VRALGHRLGVPIADKADSQDICFVPSGRYTDVIERLKPGAIESGDIVHEDGRVLGRHAGIVHYTIGQRRGLGIAGPEPLFVVRLDADTHQVIVGPRDRLATCELLLREVNWLGDGAWRDQPATGLAIAVRIRSTHRPQPATLIPDECGARVRLSEPEHGVAAGQACVFYADATPRARVLGGGWIARAIRPADTATEPSQATKRRDALAVAESTQ
jgi:tRNA-uridine 2-sulfurtransferase